MTSTVWIGRLFGIRIGLHYSWLLIFVFLSWSLATNYFPASAAGWAPGAQWALGAAAALMLFASVLAHELGHALVAQRRNLPVDDITLFLFGGVASLRREPPSPGTELVIAIAGPAVSLALAGGFALLALATQTLSTEATTAFSLLASMNLLLGLFNLIPGFPLDGGRALRAAIWSRTGNSRRATRIASVAGRWISYGFVSLGVIGAFSGDLFGGIWLAFIGWFLGTAATSSEQYATSATALRGVPVTSLMVAASGIELVGPAVSVEEFLTRHPAGGQQSIFPVMVGASLAGLVTLSEARRVSADLRASTPLGRVMTPLARLATVGPADDCATALERLTRAGAEQLLIVDGFRLVGMVSRTDLLRRLEAEPLEE